MFRSLAVDLGDFPELTLLIVGQPGSAVNRILFTQP